MSYEGYEVWLCKSGHKFSDGCYTAPSRSDWKCPRCGEKMAFWMSVDQTNGCYDDIPSSLAPEFEKIGEEKETCGFCEGTGERTVDIFKIPKDRSEVKRRKTGTLSEWADYCDCCNCKNKPGYEHLNDNCIDCTKRMCNDCKHVVPGREGYVCSDCVKDHDE